MTTPVTAQPAGLTRPLRLARMVETAWVHAVTRFLPQAAREEERRERLQILDLEISERHTQEPDTAIAADLLRRLVLSLPMDAATTMAAWRPCTNCVVRRTLRAG